jgi:hypothetical protein
MSRLVADVQPFGFRTLTLAPRFRRIVTAAGDDATWSGVSSSAPSELTSAPESRRRLTTLADDAKWSGVSPFWQRELTSPMIQKEFDNFGIPAFCSNMQWREPVLVLGVYKCTPVYEHIY